MAWGANTPPPQSRSEIGFRLNIGHFRGVRISIDFRDSRRGRARTFPYAHQAKAEYAGRNCLTDIRAILEICDWPGPTGM